MAILLRWHVWRPAHIVGAPPNNRLNAVLQGTINGSTGINWQLPIASWGDAHESALTEKLYTALEALNDTITGAIGFGASEAQGSVRIARNTFVLES